MAADREFGFKAFRCGIKRFDFEISGENFSGRIREFPRHVLRLSQFQKRSRVQIRADLFPQSSGHDDAVFHLSRLQELLKAFPPPLRHRRSRVEQYLGTEIRFAQALLPLPRRNVSEPDELLIRRKLRIKPPVPRAVNRPPRAEDPPRRDREKVRLQPGEHTHIFAPVPESETVCENRTIAVAVQRLFRQLRQRAGKSPPEIAFEMIRPGRQRDLIGGFQAGFGGVIGFRVAAGSGLKHDPGLGPRRGSVAEIGEPAVRAAHKKRGGKIFLRPSVDIRQTGEKQEVIPVREILRIREHLKESTLLLRGTPDPVGRLEPFVMNEKIEQHSVGGDVLPCLPFRLIFGVQKRAVIIPALESECFRMQFAAEVIIHVVAEIPPARRHVSPAEQKTFILALEALPERLDRLRIVAARPAPGAPVPDHVVESIAGVAVPDTRTHEPVERLAHGGMRHRGRMRHAGKRDETFFRMGAPVGIPLKGTHITPIRLIPSSEILGQHRNVPLTQKRRSRQQIRPGVDSDYGEIRNKF